MLGHSTIGMLVMIVLALVVFYYLMMQLTIVEVFASAAFISLLMGIGFVKHPKEVLDFAKKMLKTTPTFSCWVFILVWTVLSFWVVYEVLLA